MNRIYRTVWSEARGAYVVTHEKCTSNGKCSTTRKAIVDAVAGALLALSTSSSYAACGPSGSNYECSGTDGYQVVVNGGTYQSVNILGSAQVGGSTSPSLSLNNLTVTAGITNSGILGGPPGATPSAGLSLMGGTVAGGIVNNGLISAPYSSGWTHGGIAVGGGSTVDRLINSSAIYGAVSGVNLSGASFISDGVTNTGTIVGGFQRPGFWVQSGSGIANGLSNSGTISGGQYGLLLGPGGYPGSVGGTLSGGLMNNGTIAGDVLGIGLYSGSTVSGGIDSSGLISGGVVGIQVDSTSTITGQTAIRIHGGGSVSGGIDNAGTILSSHSGAGGIQLDSGTVTGVIANRGLISSTHPTNAGAGIGVFNNALLGGIANTNTGTISGIEGVFVGGGASIGNISNSGAIIGANATHPAWGSGIRLQNAGSSLGSIINSGTIRGGFLGIEAFDHSVINGDITNSNLISGGGGIAIGDRYFDANLNFGFTTLNGNITNQSGAVIAGSGGNFTDGVGIEILNHSTITGHIFNDGTVSGVTKGIFLGTNSSIANGITNGGMITATTGISIRSGSTVSGGVSNSGMISGYNGIVADQAVLSGGIVNTGSISVTGNGGVLVSRNGVIENGINNSAGTITGNNGIDLTGGSVSGGVINSGTISGVFNGIALSGGYISGGVTNSAGGTISGIHSSGIALFSNSVIANGVVNEYGGVIYGGGSGSSAAGILVGSGSSISGAIRNHGVINGAADGILVAGGDVDSIENGTTIVSASTYAGTIAGSRNGISIGATLSSSGQTFVSSGGVIGGITNSGLIHGAGGSGIDVYGGTIAGAIQNQIGGTVSGIQHGIRVASGASSLSTSARVHVGMIASITNSGLISGTSGSGIEVQGGTVGDIVNLPDGTISGGQSGIRIASKTETAYSSSGSSVQRQYQGTVGSIINSGSIIGINGVGVLLTGGAIDRGITNSGTLSGGWLGIQLNGGGSISGGITNESTGLILGETAISIEQGGSLDFINNHGTIEGTLWQGVDIHDGVSMSGGIANSGLIFGSSSAIKVRSGAIVAAGITNSGTLSGGIHGVAIGTGATVAGIINTGLISGNSTSGIDINGGTVMGAIENRSGATIAGAVHGIRIGSAMSSGTPVVHGAVGSIVNSGMIEASGNTGAAYGIRVTDGAYVGTGITSSGVILAVNSSSTGYGIGIDRSSTVSGGITNSGTIAGSYDGIFVGSSSIDGGITNSGSISGAGWGGIDLHSATVSGDLVNDANATISGLAPINLNAAHLVGNIVNHGVLNGTGTGVWISDHSSISGSIENTGTIVGGSSGGININSASTVSGAILNRGTIAADLGRAIAVLSGSTVTQGILNDLNATIQGGQTAIAIEGATLSGGITNYGLIRSTGSTGVLIQSASTLSGGLVNSGIIQGGGNWGIRVRSGSLLANGIVNSASGTISGMNTAIQIQGGAAVSGGLTNAGTISGGAGPGHFAINANGGSLDNIIIIGSDTAKFIGEVYAPNTTVTVSSNATYTMDNGNKFSVSNFSNVGTLKIGAGSTATVSGDFSNSGTFSPAVAGVSSYGKLEISGTATLSGTIAIDVIGTPTIANGSTLVGVIHAGAIGGSFGNVVDNSALFDFSAHYSTNTVDLTIAAMSTTGVLDAVNSVANTPAQGVAAVLDAVIASTPPSMAGVVTTLGQLATQQQVSNAASQTLPLLTGDGDLALNGALSDINRVVQARIEGNRGMSSGDSFAGDRHVWLKPFGSRAEQHDEGAVAGFKAGTSGFALGGDTALSDRQRVGIAFAYANASIDGKSSAAPQNAKVDLYHLIAYGSFGLTPETELNYQFDVGKDRIDGTRHLLFAGATAISSYDAVALHAGVGIARTYAWSGANTIVTSARVDYSHIRDQAYSERGAGPLNLDIDGRTTNQLVLSIDGKVLHQLSQDTALMANLGVAHDADAKQSSVTASFAGAPGLAFTTRGIDPSAWMVRGGIGVVNTTVNGTEVTARYDAEHRSGFTNQTVSVKARWAF